MDKKNMHIFKGISENKIKELSELLKRSESVHHNPNFLKLEKALRDGNLVKAQRRSKKIKRRQLPWKKEI